MPIPTRQATPVVRPRIADEIARMLEEMIINGALAPGTPVTDEGLAERFGASRTPVREALNLLSAQGFVVTVPQRGTTVSEVSPTLYRESLGIYHALFSLALEEAIPMLTAQDRERLTRTRDTILSSVSAEREALRANTISDALFGVYFDRYGNRALNEIRARVSPQLRRALVFCEHPADAEATAALGHLREVIDASLRGDPAGALSALSAHTELILSSLGDGETDATDRVKEL